MIGKGGSGDAIATWLLLMAAGAAFGLIGGGLAYAGRWRAWHHFQSPFRYAPLAAVPFGAGCLAEIVSLVARLPAGVETAFSGALVAAGLATCLLLLRFPGWLKPGWVKAVEEQEGAGAAGSSP